MQSHVSSQAVPPDEPAVPDLGTFGVWTTAPVTPEVAAEVERLGYGAVWVSSVAPDDLSWVDLIFDRTTTLKAATGIINIWNTPAERAAEAYHRLDRDYPGRFVLGIGAGHREAITQWEKPFDALNAYLDDLDRHGVPAERRILAALGDGVLKLSARRGAGAHPYLTTPEHTARARELMGVNAFLAPEQKIVLSDDAAESRAAGRAALDLYLGLANYRNSWKRIGFEDDDIVKPGSDALVDAVIAYGTVDEIANRLRRHREAGADHVAIQVIGTADPLPALTTLAPALGLSPRS
ncbi:LLM class F420-dependent oxidoreductase [Mycolicibacterium sediminis]|uniref:LLM class F420-dependent oxidoreductase n=1 Tax=Mycolicibacterium sediminis TaxID=1286180 RepID=A0A7I7QR29_9MYCO|nr:LLM class F420-dependent oxidoreductase [Mycolicibacterium sediminis]BBY28774.1 LLM class F420-dependent oxidoreductase [Mycolicibacterium sediminis]